MRVACNVLPRALRQIADDPGLEAWFYTGSAQSRVKYRFQETTTTIAWDQFAKTP
jgi:hypothetical protein